jgi:Tol biopolymer transport system component
VFYRQRANGKCQIVTIGVDGKDEITVVKDDANNVHPSFLKSGRIGFSAERESKASIMTVEPDGTKPVQVGVADAWFARWSPDGTRVAYITGRFPESKIYLMNSDTTGVRALEP